ncbi:MAG TPA: tRNA dihydrouridine synthase DusB [Chthoniobacterales bacterium]
MLPWFQNQFPLYLAPMAGVTDHIFRALCKEQGADVLVTEFVSAEGILRRNERTCEYLKFSEVERPLGVQLFGAEPETLAEAAKAVIDWVQPDFIDLNFGCPVNKVVSKLGGSALLKDCPLLGRVAEAVVRGASEVPVTGKIRIGWSDTTINARETAHILENSGVQAVAVHGRTKEQGYSGQANWDVIGEVAEAISIPVIGNGDISSAMDVMLRRAQTRIAGVMIGRSAMSSPWIFRQIRHHLATGELLPEPSMEKQWEFILRHCELTVADRGREIPAMHSLRARLMAYSRGMPGGKLLRGKFQSVSTLDELRGIAGEHLASLQTDGEIDQLSMLPEPIAG